MILYESERANPSGGIYHQWNENLCFSSHLHDSFELIYVFEGCFSITVDDARYDLHQGEAIIVFPNQIHTAYAASYSKTYLCIFENSLVGEFYRAVKDSLPVRPIFAVDASLINDLFSESESRYLLKSRLYELIHLFDLSAGGYKKRRSKPSEHLGQILTYIAHHHTEEISMRDVARSVGYDYHYLSNLIQKNMNTTFRTLLNEYRISHAKYLLLTTNKTVSDISEECGYESLCSFNRNFKSIAGLTPTEYRMQKKNLIYS